MLHSALHDAMRWGYLVRNVAEAADPPAARSPEQQVWSPQELGAFLDHVRDDRLYALWLLVATTGMRRGELAGLRWVDIDFDHATVSPTSPGWSSTTRSMTRPPRPSGPDAASPSIRSRSRHCKPSASSRVRTARRSEGATATTAMSSPGRTAARCTPRTSPTGSTSTPGAAGLPRIRLHDVRHSYATAALKAGISAKVISERLGHASAAFTLQTYGHVLPGMDRDAAATVADLILTSTQKGPEPWSRALR